MHQTGFYPSRNSSGAHKVFYQSWGEPTAKPLVCVHGLSGSSADFKYVGEYLAPLGHYVIAVDMPGRGQSDFLSDPHDYNFGQYFTDLTALFAHLKLTKFDWLGVSMGGLLGIVLAGQENSPIERMILSDVGPEVPQIALDVIKGYLSLNPVFSTIDDVVNAFKQGRGTPFSRGDMNEEQWRYYAQTHVRQNDKGLWSRSFDPGILEAFKTEPLGTENLWDHWDKITQPVLALRGELSILFTPDIASRMAQRKPGAGMDLIEIKNAGHVPSLYPDEQIKLLADWLR